MEQSLLGLSGLGLNGPHGGNRPSCGPNNDPREEAIRNMSTLTRLKNVPTRTRLTAPAPKAPAPKAPAPRAPSQGIAPPSTVAEKCSVTVEVEYGKPSNLRVPADALAQAIQGEFAPRGVEVRVELVPSRAGVFEVAVDGKRVYSKRATFRLPTHHEIFYHVEAAASARRKRVALSRD